MPVATVVTVQNILKLFSVAETERTHRGHSLAEAPGESGVGRTVPVTEISRLHCRADRLHAHASAPSGPNVM